jgi:hypothetical protein
MGLVRSRRALLILPFRGKTYYGFDAGSGAAVFVSRQGETMTPLHLRLDLADHSPGGLAAGDSSQGSTQLALAILADWFECDYELCTRSSRPQPLRASNRTIGR